MCSGGSDWTCLQPGFPIRKSSDHSLVIDSPRLIADSYVLLRFLVPRHPPCALKNLICTKILRCSRPLCSSQHTGGPWPVPAPTSSPSPTRRIEPAVRPRPRPCTNPRRGRPEVRQNARALRTQQRVRHRPHPDPLSTPPEGSRTREAEPGPVPNNRCSTQSTRCPTLGDRPGCWTTRGGQCSLERR